MWADLMRTPFSTNPKIGRIGQVKKDRGQAALVTTRDAHKNGTVNMPADGPDRGTEGLEHVHGH